MLVSWGRCFDYWVQPAIELPKPDLSAGYRISCESSTHYRNIVLTVIPDRRTAVLDEPFGLFAGCEVLSLVNESVEREVEAGFSFGFSSHNFDPLIELLLMSYISIIVYGRDTLGQTV